MRRFNPVFHLTEGQACDLDGTDVLAPPVRCSRTVIADKGFDADKRVLEPLQQASQPVIPPKANRKVQRRYDKELYKARHLIENFFAKLKLFRCPQPATTKQHVTSSQPYTSATVAIWLN